MTTDHDGRDLTTTDITAETLHMVVEGEEYREPNRKKRLVMFTKWHTEGSNNYGQTDCQTTLPEAYQMTPKKPPDILPKLPTKMAAEKSTKNALKLKEDCLQMKQKPNRITC
jgi:hypothetical protein